jgi:hypothetical protein
VKPFGQDPGITAGRVSNQLGFASCNGISSFFK